MRTTQERPPKQLRKVFGFLCDLLLAGGIRGLAKQLGVPIFAVAEHCLQIGFIIINMVLTRDPKRKAEAIAELKSHLREMHSLKPQLEDSHYEHGLIAALTYDSPEASTTHKEIAKMLVRAEKAGIPHELFLTTLAAFVNRWCSRWETKQKIREFNRNVRFLTLKKIFQEDPRLITEVLNVSHLYGGVDIVAEALGARLERGSSKRPGKHG